MADVEFLVDSNPSLSTDEIENESFLYRVHSVISGFSEVEDRSTSVCQLIVNVKQQHVFSFNSFDREQNGLEQKPHQGSNLSLMERSVHPNPQGSTHSGIGILSQSHCQEKDNIDLLCKPEFCNAIRRNHPAELSKCLRSMSYIRVALQIVEAQPEGNVSILMLAAYHGSEDVVSQLLSWNPSFKHLNICGDVLLRDETMMKGVTALWCAIERGHYRLANMLLREGAIRLGQRSNKSLLSDFIKRNELGAIEFLLNERSALALVDDCSDLRHYLDVAVHSGHVNIVLRFLQNDIGRAVKMGPSDSHTLELAIEHGHYECVRVLYGSEVFLDLDEEKRLKFLRLAVDHNHLDILDFLLDIYHDETSINKAEIFVSEYMISAFGQPALSEAGRAYHLLKYILQKRASLRTPKRINPPLAAYEFRQECQTVEDLEKIQNDPEEIFIQALLIRERLLLSKGDQGLIMALDGFGMLHAKRDDFDQCLRIWIHGFELRQKMTMETDLQNFVWLFCHMLVLGVPICIDSLLDVCKLVLHPSQSELTTRRLAAAVCLIAIVGKLLDEDGRSSLERRSMLQWIESLCQRRMVSVEDGRTLLHLSVSDRTYEAIDFRRTEIQSVLIFPNRQATWLFIHCGRRWIDMDALEGIFRDTPLHRIARSVTGINAIEIIKLLIDAEAHIDCLNGAGETPAEVAVRPEIKAFLQSKQILPKLKCLCARLIAEEGLDYKSPFSSRPDLYRFIVLHGDLPPNSDLNEEDETLSSIYDPEEDLFF